MLPEVPLQSRDEATLAKKLTVKCGRRNRIGVDLIRYYESRCTPLSNAVLPGLMRLIHRAYESAKLHAFIDKKSLLSDFLCTREFGVPFSGRGLIDI